jgi:hypothetical protein
MVVRNQGAIGSSIFAIFAVLLGLVFLALPLLTLSGNELETLFAYASLLAAFVEMCALVWVKTVNRR